MVVIHYVARDLHWGCYDTELAAWEDWSKNLNGNRRGDPMHGPRWAKQPPKKTVDLYRVTCRSCWEHVATLARKRLAGVSSRDSNAPGQTAPGARAT